MDQVHDRHMGVAEARVGLSIITCLLLVLGYVVLQQLGGTGRRPPVENRSDGATELVEITPPPEAADAEQPYVLTPEIGDGAEPAIRTTQRPERPSPHEAAGDDSPALVDPLELPAGQFGELPGDQSEPLRASRVPDPDAVR
jgi:hypothetical protein